MSQRGPEKPPSCFQPAGRAEGWRGQRREAPRRAGLGSLLSGRVWLCSVDWSRWGNHIREQGSGSLVLVPCSCTGALAVCWECLVQLHGQCLRKCWSPKGTVALGERLPNCRSILRWAFLLGATCSVPWLGWQWVKSLQPPGLADSSFRSSLGSYIPWC